MKLRRCLSDFFPAGAAVVAGFGAAAVAVLIAGRSPGTFLAAYANGAFGNSTSVATSLVKTTPLILTGLSVAVAFRCGLFNIGSEGQLYVGGIAAAFVGAALGGLPRLLHVPLVLLAGAACGGIWGLLPGWLKARRGVHEVVSTMMMNYIGIHLAGFLVHGPLGAGELASIQTAAISPSARLPVIWGAPAMDLSCGILIALVLCGSVYVLLTRTSLGYEIRAVGSNSLAAQSAGISLGRLYPIVMAICGGLSGLAGALQVAGFYHTFYVAFSPGYGFDGIAVALLVGNQALAVPFAALLFGSFRTAGNLLQHSGISPNIIYVLQAVVIAFVGLRVFLRTRRGALASFMRRRAPAAASRFENV